MPKKKGDALSLQDFHQKIEVSGASPPAEDALPRGPSGLSGGDGIASLCTRAAPVLLPLSRGLKMQLLLPRVAVLAFLRSWSVVDTTLDVPRRFLRWRVQCNTGYSCLRLPARLWRWRRMTGPRLIGRLEAEHLEKPATTSKTPQNAQTSLVVGMPGAPSLQQETEPKKARQGYSRSPLYASVGPRRGRTGAAA